MGAEAACEGFEVEIDGTVDELQHGRFGCRNLTPATLRERIEHDPTLGVSGSGIGRGGKGASVDVYQASNNGAVGYGVTLQLDFQVPQHVLQATLAHGQPGGFVEDLVSLLQRRIPDKLSICKSCAAREAGPTAPEGVQQMGITGFPVPPSLSPSAIAKLAAM